MITPVLALQNVSFTRNQRSILTDISWQVSGGQIAAILGPNGCGKSTLLRIIAGYLWPQAGSVQLLGETFGETPLAPLRARVGILEASAVFPFDDDMTAGDVVTSGYFSALTLGYLHPTAEQVAHAEHLLDQVGLAAHIGQFYASLSTGERLRCLLARALVRKPELLLLDEPTAGLDLPAREAALATLARLHGNGAGRSGSRQAKTGVPDFPGRTQEAVVLPREHASGHRDCGQKHGTQNSFPGSMGTPAKTAREGASTSGPAMITVTHHLEELLPGTSNVLLLSQAGTIVAQGPPAEVLTDRHMSRAFGVPIQVVPRHGRFYAHVDPATWSELL